VQIYKVFADCRSPTLEFDDEQLKPAMLSGKKTPG